MNAEDGSVRWKVQIEEGGAISNRPLIVDDTIYVVTDMGSLYAVNIESGTPRWNKKVEDARLYSAPVVAGDTILIAAVGTDAVLYAFDLDGIPKWQFVPAK